MTERLTDAQLRLLPKESLVSMILALRAERDKLAEALRIPEVWSQIERDGMAEAFRAANGTHGHYETLFAVAAWLLRHRAALSGSAQSEEEEIGERLIAAAKEMRASVALLEQSMEEE